jgi:hypothetical protein
MTNQEYWEKLIEKYDSMTATDFKDLLKSLSKEPDPFLISDESVDGSEEIDNACELKKLLKDGFKKMSVKRYPNSDRKKCMYVDKFKVKFSHKDRKDGYPVYDILSCRKYIGLEDQYVDTCGGWPWVMYSILREVTMDTYIEIVLDGKKYFTSKCFNDAVISLFEDKMVDAIKELDIDNYFYGV